jgi:hypothetical protein
LITVTGFVTVVPLADCTVCTVYWSYGTTHCASVSTRMDKMIYFMMLFIDVLKKSQAGYMCYVVVCINCLPGSLCYDESFYSTYSGVIPAASTRRPCARPDSPTPSQLSSELVAMIAVSVVAVAHVALRAVALKINRVNTNTLVTSATSVACAIMAVVWSMFIIVFVSFKSQAGCSMY